MAIVRELVTKWVFRVKDKDLDKFNAKIKSAKKSLKGVADGSLRVGKNLSTFVTLPVLGLGAAFIKAASDAEETFSKFATVFDDVSEEAEKTAKNLTDNFGLSSVAAKQLLSDTGDLLSGFGFTGEVALDLSKQVSELAVDLASFTNLTGGAERASAALTKALLGENESVKSLGISILEKDVKARIKQLRAQGKLLNATERQAKAFATLLIAQEQSQKAIGDFARTSQAFANQTRILKARINDMAVSFGRILLPIANKLVKSIIRLVKRFENLSLVTKKFILITGGVAAVLGPLLIIFGLVVNSLFAIGGAVKFLLPLISKLTLKTLLIGAAWIAVASIIFLIFEDIIAFFQGKDSVTGILVDGFNMAIDSIQKKFETLPDIVKRVIKKATFPIRLFINTLQALGGVIGAVVGGDFKLALEAVKEAFKETVDPAQDVGALLGFSARERRPTPGLPTAPTARAGANVNVNAPVTVVVPPGTPPEQVGEKAREGIENSMGNMLRTSFIAVQGAGG